MLVIRLWLVFLVALHVGCAAEGDDGAVIERAIPRKSFVVRSRASFDTVHELVFAVKQLNLDVVERELIQRSTPGSPLYQQWLTHEHIGHLVKNPTGAMTVEQWLVENGANVTWKSKRLEYIKAEAPMSTWERLLSTTFYEWTDETQPSPNRKVVHRAKEYKLPRSVSRHLHAVFHTVQTPPAWKPQYHMRDASTDGGSLRKGSATHALANGEVTVPFLNQLYGIPSNTGSSAHWQAVFETGAERYSPQDLARFQQIYNIPLQPVAADFGYSTTDCKANSCYEGNLDVQYMMGVAQSTKMVYWYQGGNDPFIDWITAVADSSDPPLVNSISWGSTEQANSAESMRAFNTEAMKLALMGVTIVVSTGDDGAAGSDDLCNLDSSSNRYAKYWKGEPWSGRGYFPSFPATSPYVTAVGATMGPESGNPEIACQSQLGGVITTGGGFSTFNPTPSWQVDTVQAYFAALGDDQRPTPGYNPHGRAYPDVSLIGVEYATVIANRIQHLFGTSASAPVLAAMVSLINAARVTEGKPPVGFINPTLWAHSQANAALNPYNVSGFDIYSDVTSGHNKCMAYNGGNYAQGAICCSSGFYATEGWDPVTGLGSITFENLSKILAAPVIVSLGKNSNEADDGSTLMLIILSILVGAVLVATLVIGTVYSLCCMPRAPSQYAPAARAEVALTHFPPATPTVRTMLPQQATPPASFAPVGNPLYARSARAGTYAAVPTAADAGGDDGEMHV